MLLIKIFFWLVKKTLELVHTSNNFLEWQAVKLTFFAPWGVNLYVAVTISCAFMMTAFWKLLKQQFDHYLSGNSIGKTNKLCSPLKYTQGCALAELSGSWRLTFVLGRLENLSFSKEIIRRAHWISQVQSTGLLSVFLEHNLDIDPVDSVIDALSTFQTTGACYLTFADLIRL